MSTTEDRMTGYLHNIGTATFYLRCGRSSSRSPASPRPDLRTYYFCSTTKRSRNTTCHRARPPGLKHNNRHRAGHILERHHERPDPARDPERPAATVRALPRVTTWVRGLHAREDTAGQFLRFVTVGATSMLVYGLVFLATTDLNTHSANLVGSLASACWPTSRTAG